MLHEQLISETGGIQGLRDEGMLESALSSPFQSRLALIPLIRRFSRRLPDWDTVW